MNEYKAIFNPDSKDTYWWISKGLMLAGHIGDMGKGDCIGGTFEAFIAYQDRGFIDAVWRLWHKDASGKYHGERYPEYNMVARPMSRDHVINTMLLLYYADELTMLADFVENTPFKIDRTYHTPDMWFWKHAILGEKFHRFMYYTIQIPLMGFTTVKEKLLRPLFRIKPERTQNSWDRDYPLSVSKRKRWWMNKLLFPVYALSKLGWMISCLPDTRARRVLKWICRPQMGKTNYSLHMLFGRPVDKANLIRYQSMTGDRVSTSLDIRNDRHCVIIKNNTWTQYNRLDKDLMLAMFEMRF